MYSKAHAVKLSSGRYTGTKDIQNDRKPEQYEKVSCLVME